MPSGDRDSILALLRTNNLSSDQKMAGFSHDELTQNLPFYFMLRH
ncbi:hypothetical protein HMPREF1567_2860 [Providencia alcalifaciens PAL-2]|uniref:Uncharacterized protein n=1 Tax=Providencia alcalifaciens DSM 30120 TaxID=520999 RepID=B6XFT2_9GAMM|nr:hypothetical protein PROVALCAL_02217 [Providencia alcalifaciens DSM 30120]ETT04064.1 hypothetical protein HMPREF1562_2971 [Providencia alcalifaciens F90-2004]EUC95909.1 hypothetical protein HMPREF1567_2860 [Providencia alcalifaciens PAL-2]